MRHMHMHNFSHQNVFTLYFRVQWEDQSMTMAYSITTSMLVQYTVKMQMQPDNVKILVFELSKLQGNWRNHLRKKSVKNHIYSIKCQHDSLFWILNPRWPQNDSSPSSIFCIQNYALKFTKIYINWIHSNKIHNMKYSYKFSNILHYCTVLILREIPRVNDFWKFHNQRFQFGRFQFGRCR